MINERWWWNKKCEVKRQHEGQNTVSIYMTYDEREMTGAWLTAAAAVQAPRSPADHRVGLLAPRCPPCSRFYKVYEGSRTNCWAPQPQPQTAFLACRARCTRCFALSVEINSAWHAAWSRHWPIYLLEHAGRHLDRPTGYFLLLTGKRRGWHKQAR